MMTTAEINKTEEKVTDWINPDLKHPVKLKEYRKEMLEGENTGFISFEDHKKNMNQWLTTATFNNL